MPDSPERPTAPGTIPFPAPAEDLQATTAAPSIVDDREHRLDRRWVKVARLTAGIWIGGLALVGFVGLVSTMIATASAWAPWAMLVTLGGFVAIFGLQLGWAMAWPALRYRYASYRVNERGLQIKDGVVWRSVTTVPKSRVQHTDVTQGPLARGFGLAALVIHTAGTEHASVTLNGLPRDVAFAIRNHLINVDGDDAV